MPDIDEHLKAAMERGDFDDLPGVGKPLNLYQDAFTAPENRLAYKIMRDNDVLPDWIAAQTEIDHTFKKAAQTLERAWRRYEDLKNRHAHKTDPASVRLRLDNEDAWQNAQAVFRQAVAALNKKILTYNLKVPALHLTRNLLDAEHEMVRIGQGKG